MSAPPAPLRCFQHCRKDTDLVCLRLPERCPLCAAQTALTPCRIPPYVLPSPFLASTAAPRAVVVRPTDGTFLSHYSSVCDLHIGLTDGAGRVTEFDQRGLTVGSLWPQCLVVLTCPASAQCNQPPSGAQCDQPPSGAQCDQPPSGAQLERPEIVRPGDWDSALDQLRQHGELWDSRRYAELTWNCFDLVLHFLSQLTRQRRLLGLDLHFDLDPPLGSGGARAELCERFLVQKCRRAGEYVELYRRVLAEGCVCVARRKHQLAA
ncbi:hypothetical protein EGW08_005435 [Elysia chlorotica]|uniref:MKRN2 opposite strand protein n=1 Tax=Elysia chlorotica TaxID=188477 RepID=A0A433TYZ0_ELYCH|nr:hypothetical protein EGW08_005435 [Elysia chlorotica]